MDALIHRDAEALTELFRDELRRGRPWLEALFHVISLWEIGEETTDGQHYRYLIGGEALDWLRLAERLCADAAGLLPDEEVEALLVEGRFPAPLTEERLQEYLGPTKYRAHLNFVYGVRVEEALHLAVEEAVQKERRSRATGYDARVDEDVFQRIYGAPRLDLLAAFRREEGRPQSDRIGLAELNEFTYWLFKRRMAMQDPARVASDTRRGLLTLHQLEERRQRRRRGTDPDEGTLVVESHAIPVR